MVAILTFTNYNPKNPKDFREEKEIQVEYSGDKPQLNSIAQAIANVKTHADEGESLSNFKIPDNWKILSWSEKIDLAAAHIESIAGGFHIIGTWPIIEVDCPEA